MPLTFAKNVETRTVGMGQIFTGRGPTQLTAVLGSCVGVALYHPRLAMGILAHVVLPDSGGRPSAAPGKFADTAIPHMVQLLGQQGATASGAAAEIAGGACMFGNGPIQIGDSNVKAVLAALAKAGIRVTSSDVGGTRGRRVCLDCQHGSFRVETVSPRS